MATLRFTRCSFNELTTAELYTILQLRAEVFVVEQQCPYQDLDNKDLQAYHLCGWMDETLVAYARLLPAGVSYPDASSIGRVVSKPSFRTRGLGKQLMEEAIRQTEALFPGFPITISAQHYLLRFYESFGFKARGDVYLEDDIPHQEMILTR